MYIKLSAVSLAVVMSLHSYAQAPGDAHSMMPVLLAQTYDSKIDISEYWKSEKLDGIRAVWDGNTLRTRNGNVIHAPNWFVEVLPDYPVEGELWAGRGQFHIVQQTVLDSEPVTPAWEKIDFMLFDMPTSAGDYQKRYFDLTHLVRSIDAPHIKYVVHSPIMSEQELVEHLDHIDGQQGEGIMLRKITSRYQAGRSTDLLKMKHHQDAEAIVVGYKVGSGKYRGMMGSLLVELDSGLQFYIGSGFTEQQRREPPELGATVTFRYNGHTQNGVPKFARYIRERSAEMR